MRQQEDNRPAPAGRAATVEVLRTASQLHEMSSSWDSLAVVASRPYCSPGWMLPWWGHVRPRESALRAVTVRDGAELTGILPLSVTSDRWGISTGSVLAHDTSSYSEPLASPGREREVAAAITTSLSAGGVDVMALSGIPADSPWPGLLQDAWPGSRPRLSLVTTMRAPYVDLGPGGFEEWFSGRSRNFRQQARSRKREFLRRGGDFRKAESVEEQLRGLQEFERLHLGRWANRGGSQALVPGVMEMLREASGVLGSDRFHVWTAEVNGEIVAAAIFLQAGHEVHFWLGGFDETWAPLSLSVLLLVEAVQHAADTGCSRVSFGPGEQPYKYRLATGDERLDWVDLIPVGRRYPYVRLVQLPQRTYRVAARRTPPKVKERIRSLVGASHVHPSPDE